ncbi:MAG: neutral/alkaline non-lysosomal ceramidase N-terminal domain-containing protein [Candidatus Poribacteria bacterium]|nr:neutral/alkaline non-lysosomal ceramidase N-terminal domain-containing protein [Candidatus Poribacteria bacterium]
MLKAGFARVPITPPVGTALAGYFNTRHSVGVLDDLYAHAMLLDNGDSKLAWVTCDLIGVTRDMTRQVRERLADLLPPDAIIVSATHTHTGPSLTDSTYTPINPEWAATLPQLIAGAVRTAFDRLAPAEIAVAVGNEPTVAFNRRFRMEDGSVVTNPGVNNPKIVESVGPIDPDVGVLYVRDLESKRPLGAFVNYTCHTDTTSGSRISADYPGHLQRILRQVFGDEFVTLFGMGASGDINHVDVTGRVLRNEHRTSAERIGTVLAGEVIKVVGGMQRFETEIALGVALADFEIPYRVVTPEQVAEAKAILEADKTPHPSTSQPERLQAQKIVTLSELDESGRATEIQAARVGDLSLLCAPGEIFVELGLEMKRRSVGSPTFVIELANDTTGYLPTAKALIEGGYEASSSRYAEHAGEALIDALIDTEQKARS